MARATGTGPGKARHEESSDRDESIKKIRLDKGILKRLLTFGIKYWYMFAASFLMIMIVSLFRLVTPIIMKVIIDDYIYAGSIIPDR